MEFNADKVRKISSEMMAALERLEDLKRLPKDEFLSDPHKIGSAKYSLIVAIEGAIDLSNHQPRDREERLQDPGGLR